VVIFPAFMRGSECLFGRVFCFSGFGRVNFLREFHAGSNLPVPCQFEWNMAEAASTVWCEKWADRNPV